MIFDEGTLLKAPSASKLIRFRPGKLWPRNLRKFGGVMSGNEYKGGGELRRRKIQKKEIEKKGA